MPFVKTHENLRKNVNENMFSKFELGRSRIFGPKSGLGKSLIYIRFLLRIHNVDMGA